MSTELTGAPAPSTNVRTGFFQMPADLYHALDAVSQSRLKLLAKSPAHLRWELDHPTPPTEAMKRGTLAHLATLEPHAFHNSYVVVPESLAEGITTADGKPAKSPKATGEYKERLRKFAVDNFGKEFISAEEWDTAQGIAASIRRHPDASLFVSEAQNTELTGIWQDEETGLLCKMRVDADCPDLDTLFDIKTTTDASRAAFEKTIFNFRYYWQAAMYLEGMAILGRPRRTFAIIAVESEPPYACAVYNLKAEVIELARKEIRPLMRLYAACVKQGVWPAYPSGIQDIAVPQWAINQIERDLV